MHDNSVQGPLGDSGRCYQTHDKEDTMTTTKNYRGYKIELRGDWFLAKSQKTNRTLTTGNTIDQVHRGIDHFLDRNCSMHKGQCNA